MNDAHGINDQNGGKILYREDNKRVAFLTLGCKVNAYETEAMEKLFREAGYEVVDFADTADVYVVNTCTVTNIADRKSRQMLHRARKNNPDGIVVAAGCYVQAPQSVLDADDTVDLLVGNSQKQDVVKLVEACMQEKGTAKVPSTKEPPAPLSEEYDTLEIDTVTEKTRANIKIQDGCNQFCSYCIIPYVRGRIRSRKQEAVIAEVERLVALGYQEVVLTGIHLSSYGKDLDGESHLLSLLQKLQNIEGLSRIRLGSLEPRIMTEEFVSELAALDKVCPHFHLSLQSGCDATLKRMNRHYTAAEYLEACERLKRVYGNPALTTDVIVGFPGETEEEFQQTKAFVQQVGCAGIHIFPYSKRTGTRAEKMEGQLQESVKKVRAAELAQVEALMADAYRRNFEGAQEWVLFEEEMEYQGKIWQVGHTARYVKVAVQSEENLSNQLRPVKDLTLSEGELMLGSVI